MQLCGFKKIPEQYKKENAIILEKYINKEKSDLYVIEDNELSFIAGKQQEDIFKWYDINNNRIEQDVIDLSKVDLYKNVNGVVRYENRIVSEYSLKEDEVAIVYTNPIRKYMDILKEFEIVHSNKFTVDFWRSSKWDGKMYHRQKMPEGQKKGASLLQWNSRGVHVVDTVMNDEYQGQEIGTDIGDIVSFTAQSIYIKNRMYRWQNQDKAYFHILWQKKELETEEMLYPLNNLQVRKKYGFIYLDNITEELDENKKYKLVLIANRKLDVEFYNTEKSIWENLQALQIQKDSKLSLRIKMENSDKIKSIFLI